MAPKPSLNRLMDEENLTVGDLARKSGLSKQTVQRAVRGDDEVRLNTTSASAIASALGTEVGAINWPGGLSNSGRPALSGGKPRRRRS